MLSSVDVLIPAAAVQLLEAEVAGFEAVLSRAEETARRIVADGHGGNPHAVPEGMTAKEVCERDLILVTVELPSSRDDWKGWYAGKMNRQFLEHPPYHWYRYGPREWLAAAQVGVAVEYSPTVTFPDGGKLAWVWCSPEHARAAAKDPVSVEEYRAEMAAAIAELKSLL